MKKSFLLWMGVVLMMVVGMSSCSSDDEDNNLYNTWILVSYGNESNEVLKEAKGYYYLITFHPDGTYSGQAYGNKMGGKYACIGHMIRIIDGDVTQRGVEGADPDRFFFTHLREIYTYKISTSELRLYYSKDEYFKFRIK